MNKRQLPYFKRIIWFYLIIPDGIEAPYKGYLDEPTDTERKEFIMKYHNPTFVTEVRWIGTEIKKQ